MSDKEKTQKPEEEEEGLDDLLDSEWKGAGYFTYYSNYFLVITSFD